MSKIKMPVLDVKLVPIGKVKANDYNPNNVAKKEMKLLMLSIKSDGITQPIVTFYNPDSKMYEIVDGFHRYQCCIEFKLTHIPVVVIEKSIKERMASTIRHNRARGKHVVDLQAELVKKLLKLGWKDLDVAKELGMTAEEVLRLKQQVGIAPILSNNQYGTEWVIE